MRYLGMTVTEPAEDGTMVLVPLRFPGMNFHDLAELAAWVHEQPDPQYASGTLFAGRLPPPLPTAARAALAEAGMPPAAAWLAWGRTVHLDRPGTAAEIATTVLRLPSAERLVDELAAAGLLLKLAWPGLATHYVGQLAPGTSPADIADIDHAAGHPDDPGPDWVLRVRLGLLDDLAPLPAGAGRVLAGLRYIEPRLARAAWTILLRGRTPLRTEDFVAQAAA